LAAQRRPSRDHLIVQSGPIRLPVAQASPGRERSGRLRCAAGGPRDEGGIPGAVQSVVRMVRDVDPQPLVDESAVRTSLPLAFLACAAVGVLGGMIGLGGAEFRLPLLIAVFGFVALQAVIVNKALSLVVVTTALPARLVAVPWSELASHWTVAANLLAGSLVGAWVGASWATRMRSATLYRVLAALLVLIAAALVGSHIGKLERAPLGSAATVVAGVVAGLFIGVIAAIMGVAGGELLIPTIVLLFGLGIKLAGSLSLAVSLPTMVVAFARYSRDGSFVVLRRHGRLVAAMALGSVAGTVLGGLLLGVAPDEVLVPTLALVLVLSSVKVWRHARE
jgi:uncharacterized membrane protein YfcA